MRAEFWAVLTAACWAAGSLLEKKGIKAGGLSPALGASIRTAVSLLILFFLSYPYWGQLRHAGAKSILMVAIGGGVISGALGIMFLYTGLKSGNLSSVMTIAFCLAPVIGAVLGYIFLSEKLSVVQVIGVVLCVTGAAMTIYFKK